MISTSARHLDFQAAHAAPVTDQAAPPAAPSPAAKRAAKPAAKKPASRKK